MYIVEMYYHRSWRVWVIYKKDLNGDQIGDCEYTATKKEALQRKSEMEVESSTFTSGITTSNQHNNQQEEVMSATSKQEVNKSQKPASKKEQLPAPPKNVKIDMKSLPLKADDKKAEPTRDELIACGKDMNVKMGLKPAIDVKVNAQAIARDIMKNAADLDHSDFDGSKAADEQISEATKATLAKLGYKVPADPKGKKAAKEEQKNGKAKSTSEIKAAKKEQKAAKAEKKEKYTRYMAVVDCLKKVGKKGISFADIQSKSDELYVAKGGASNSKTVNEIRFMLYGLVAFNALSVEGKGKDEVYKLVSKEA